jgi:hypothetical protein
MNSRKTKIILGFVFICICFVVAELFYEYNVFLKNLDDKKTTVTKQINSQYYILNSTSTNYTKEDKIVAVKTLKDISHDETLDREVRVMAGQKVVGTFFNYGANLTEGFSTSSEFSEREVYEYAKYVATLGGSGRNDLLTAYIGLRFYDKEQTKESVTALIHSYQKYIDKNGENNICGDRSKLASVIYLSQKSGHTDVSNEFGDYYTNFEKAFNADCSQDGKVMVAFMWLAAVSDIGNSPKENKKAQELLTLVTKDTSNNSSLVRNLKQSYLSEIKEPDTVSIVERLVLKYPEFKVFVDALR